jgi:ankyrin repeat protein
MNLETLEAIRKDKYIWVSRILRTATLPQMDQLINLGLSQIHFPYGRTALTRAVKNHHVEAVDYLIHRLHLDPNQAENNEMTPLHRACSCGNFPVIRLLLALGADPHQRWALMDEEKSRNFMD